VGPVTVTFEEAEDLDTGVFRIRSSTGAAPGGIPGAPPGVDPGPPPPYQVAAGQFGSQAQAQASGPWLSPPAPSSASLDVDGRIHRLAAPVTVIGRSTEADIVLDDAGVSRRHAEVHLVDGRARVIDLGSTNGTFVDGERVHAGNLTEGSTITVGRTRIIYHSGQW
jgi:hypothetical protein